MSHHFAEDVKKIVVLSVSRRWASLTGPTKKIISLESSFSPPLCIDTYVRSLDILIPVYVCKFLMRSREGEVEHQCRKPVIDTTVEKLDSRNENK